MRSLLVLGSASLALLALPRATLAQRCHEPTVAPAPLDGAWLELRSDSATASVALRATLGVTRWL